jgi:hypothetical protein
MGNKFKANKRCALSNKIINGKEVIITDYALDYVRKIGYTPIPTEKMKQILIEVDKRKKISEYNKIIAMSILLIFTLFFIPLVSSAPPNTIPGTQIIQQFAEGYTIKYPLVDNLYQNQDHEFYFHIFNISNGLPVSNLTTSCQFHLYNESSGEHMLNKTLVYNQHLNVTNEFEIEVTGGNFSQLGTYSYIVQCNSSVLGGFNNVQFNVIEKPYYTPVVTNKTLWTLDFTKPINLIGFIMLLGIAFTLFLFRGFAYSGGLLMIAGLLLMFNQINLILGLLIVAIGVAILFKK